MQQLTTPRASIWDTSNVSYRQENESFVKVNRNLNAIILQPKYIEHKGIFAFTSMNTSSYKPPNIGEIVIFNFISVT